MTETLNDQVGPSVAWLRLSDALSRLGSVSDGEISWERLSRRLETGTVRARAAVVEEHLDDGTPEVSKDQTLWRLTWASTSHALVDAATGEVEVRGSLPDDNRPFLIILHGLEVAEADLADLFQPSPSTSSSRSSGRPMGSFWPRFAEELAVYIHEEGIPDQSVPIAQVAGHVLDRLAARGRETPSLNTIRPVIRNVLDRLRQ